MSPRSVTRLGLAPLIAVAIVMGAGCGGEQESQGETAADAGEETEPRDVFSLQDEVAPYRKPESREPVPEIPTGPPPRELEIEDVREGSGPEVEHGDEAIVNYVGYHYANRRQFDTSYGYTSIPYKVIPGNSDFIEGFEEGIVGMRLHGRRQVTIPPHMGYGNKGFNDLVAPGETIVFLIDLEALEQH